MYFFDQWLLRLILASFETDQLIDPDRNAVVTAVFIDNDRIVCQMK